MKKILKTEDFCSNISRFGRLNEGRKSTEYEKSQTDKKSFKEALEFCCLDSFESEVEKAKSDFGYQGDNLDMLANEIMNLDHDTFVWIYMNGYYGNTLYMLRNADKDFYNELNNWETNPGGLLRNDGGWKETDKYAAILYYRYNSDLTWVCSFDDENFPTNDPRFVDYFLYEVVRIQDMDNCLCHFGFNYKKSFDLNKKIIATEYGYSDSLVNLLYNMYLKYCEAEGVEPEIK